MKLLFTSILSFTALAFFTSLPTFAQASDGETQAECLQRCLKAYQKNLAACTDSCFVCDRWIIILGCISGHTDQKCKTNCDAEAKRVLEACQRECGPSA
jgi:hypothetical protein